MPKTKLSAKEEYWQKIKDYPELNDRETRYLIKRVRDKDKDSFNKLVNSGLWKLVFRIAKYYDKNSDLTFLDAASEGNFALGRTLEHFDTDWKFSPETFIVAETWLFIHRALAELKAKCPKKKLTGGCDFIIAGFKNSKGKLVSWDELSSTEKEKEDYKSLNILQNEVQKYKPEIVSLLIEVTSMREEQAEEEINKLLKE